MYNNMLQCMLQYIIKSIKKANWSNFIQQRRGSLVLLYAFGPYVIDKALRKLELWLHNEESWPSGEKHFLSYHTCVDVIHVRCFSSLT